MRVANRYLTPEPRTVSGTRTYPTQLTGKYSYICNKNATRPGVDAADFLPGPAEVRSAQPGHSVDKLAMDCPHSPVKAGSYDDLNPGNAIRCRARDLPSDRRDHGDAVRRLPRDACVPRPLSDARTDACTTRDDAH